MEISFDDLIIGSILLLSLFYLAWEFPTHQKREIYFMNRYCIFPDSSSSEEEEDVDKKENTETKETNSNLVYSSSEEVINKKD
tara:strand:- start:213 stop:461 length:249 start_codon:yes stop_codon:yes gene_type:complete